MLRVSCGSAPVAVGTRLVFVLPFGWACLFIDDGGLRRRGHCRLQEFMTHRQTQGSTSPSAALYFVMRFMYCPFWDVLENFVIRHLYIIVVTITIHLCHQTQVSGQTKLNHHLLYLRHNLPVQLLLFFFGYCFTEEKKVKWEIYFQITTEFPCNIFLRCTIAKYKIFSESNPN